MCKEKEKKEEPQEEEEKKEDKKEEKKREDKKDKFAFLNDMDKKVNQILGLDK